MRTQTIRPRPSTVMGRLLPANVNRRSLMSTTRTHRRVASLVGAIVMLLPVSLAMAQGHGDRNRPVEITFTKWVTALPSDGRLLGRRPLEQVRRRGSAATGEREPGREPHRSARGDL